MFNISKNKYRLIASFNYNFQLCIVKFVGIHKEYDLIDAKNVEFNLEKQPIITLVELKKWLKVNFSE